LHGRTYDFFIRLPRIEFKGAPIHIKRRKALALTAYLALADQRQSRELLANLLWPDLDHEHARSAFRSTLHAMTAPMTVSWVDSDPMSVALKSDMVWVDVNAFTSLLGQRSTHDHSRERVCAECVEIYLQAIEIYQSDFMAGFNPSYSEEFDDWQRSQRQWLRWEFAEIHQRLSEYYCKQGRYDLAIKYGQQWLSLDPLHEPAHRHLMRLFVANGQRTEAFRQYERCVDILDIELASLPEAETRRLYPKPSRIISFRL
jgi:DNA-binding SARP family transcriptional activator